MYVMYYPYVCVFVEMEYQPRGDEGGVIATVSLMIFLNCRHMLAPIALNQLLVGPNMIKAIRYKRKQIYPTLYYYTPRYRI